VPELPEVQTIVNDLQKIVGDEITGFFSNWTKALKNTDIKKLNSRIRGKKIISIERIGKNILMGLSGKIFLLIHLRMTGKLLAVERETRNVERKNNKHLHHVFYLRTTNHELRTLEFHDIRKFATITFVDVKNLEDLKSKIGADPLDNSLTLANFTGAILKKPQKKIKEILMDQELISGIGNIYASEILFNANISPIRKAKSLGRIEIKSLFRNTKKVLNKAIKMRGTSISDYRDARGKKGQFQNHLKVYKRHGQKCKKCDTIIRKSIIGQRSTFYCPKCQK
jgi:formamidopyrimidine-DNA glycosylase